MANEKEVDNVRKLLYWVVGIIFLIGGGAFKVLDNANAQLGDTNAKQWRTIQNKLDKADFKLYNKENKDEHATINGKQEAIQKDVNTIKVDVGIQTVEIKAVREDMKEIKEWIKNK